MSENRTAAAPPRRTWTIIAVLAVIAAAAAGAAAFLQFAPAQQAQAQAGAELPDVADLRAAFEVNRGAAELVKERLAATGIELPADQAAALKQALEASFDVDKASARIVEAAAAPAADAPAQAAIARLATLRAEFAAMDDTAKGNVLKAGAAPGPQGQALADLLPSPKLRGANASALMVIEPVVRTIVTEGLGDIGALPAAELKKAAEQLLTQDNAEAQGLAASVEAAERQRVTAFVQALSDAEAAALKAYLEKPETVAAGQRLVDTYRKEIAAATVAAIVSYVRDNPLQPK